MATKTKMKKKVNGIFLRPSRGIIFEFFLKLHSEKEMKNDSEE